MVSDDRTVAPGDARRDAPGDVVRLAPRVDEHHAVEPGLRWHRGEQALGQLDQRLVEVARVGVEQARLPHDRLGHARVAVADDRHVVVRIEQAAALHVEEPGSVPSHEVDGLGIGQGREQSAERA